MSKFVLKAIPTRYKGYLCRSRLEARWLVFFDRLDIAFEHEPEGFVLADGSTYLPDLFLPSIRMWAEVKPSYLFQSEEMKCKMLADGTGFPVLWLTGPPDFRSYYAATWSSKAYTVVDYSLDIDWSKRILYTREGRLFSQPNYQSKSEDQFSVRYRDAVYAARSERFEESFR